VLLLFTGKIEIRGYIRFFSSEMCSYYVKDGVLLVR